MKFYYKINNTIIFESRHFAKILHIANGDNPTISVGYSFNVDWTEYKC